MSQHDYVIENDDGSVVRSDINLVLAAIKTRNAGTTAPTTTAPALEYFDTDDGLIEIRNPSDNAWLTSGPLTDAGFDINGCKGADMTSADIAATTANLGLATGGFIDISGTTGLTALGTIAAGVRRRVRFTGALILTHNATSLILPGAANITTVANDRAEFISLGSGNWICTWYTRASGSPIVGASFVPVTAAAAHWTKAAPPGGFPSAGNWGENVLDFNSVAGVPTGAVAVTIYMEISDEANLSYMAIRTNGTTNAGNIMTAYMQDTDGNTLWSSIGMTLPIDSNLLMDLYSSLAAASWADWSITCNGYWIR